MNSRSLLQIVHPGGYQRTMVKEPLNRIVLSIEKLKSAIPKVPKINFPEIFATKLDLSCNVCDRVCLGQDKKNPQTQHREGEGSHYSLCVLYNNYYKSRPRQCMTQPGLKGTSALPISEDGSSDGIARNRVVAFMYVDWYLCT